MLHKIKTIVIGFEPLVEKSFHLEQCLNSLKWFGDDEIKIHFLGVVNPDDLGIPGNLDDANWFNQIKERAETDLERRLSLSKKLIKYEVNLLVQCESSKSKSVKLFLDFAAKVNADLLILHSHTKLSFKSALGSFCDSLVDLSWIPVLVLPFEKTVSAKIKTILFPTDFSGLSQRVFEELVLWVDKLSLKIALYHRVSLPIDEILQIAMHPIESKIVLPSDFVMMTKTEVQQKANEWVAWARQRNCEVDFKMNSEKLTLPAAILNQIESRKLDLIVLPSHTSQRSVMSFRSVSKHILREAEIPVIVIPVAYIPPGDF